MPRIRHSQLLIANLISSSCKLDITLDLARLPIFRMRSDLPQMTLTDDSQNVTLGALELKRLGMHICQLFVERVSVTLTAGALRGWPHDRVHIHRTPQKTSLSCATSPDRGGVCGSVGQCAAGAATRRGATEFSERRAVAQRVRGQSAPRPPPPNHAFF